MKHDYINECKYFQLNSLNKYQNVLTVQNLTKLNKINNPFNSLVDMESHYKDSLSTAIVNMLIQCGFENSSKRALDELTGLALIYLRNLTTKVVDLTHSCNLPEADLLLGLGAMKIHNHNLNDLFTFLHNYNDIFPPAPRVLYGPVPISEEQAPRRLAEIEAPEFVSWVPELGPALTAIGMRVHNNQVVLDPGFDHSRLLTSYSEPGSSVSVKPETAQSIAVENSAVAAVSCSSVSAPVVAKYGAHCRYQLPPEAMPTKYEAPTIDYDTAGAIVGLNGRPGKLPDPFINDLEEQDLMRRKARFVDPSETPCRHRQQRQQHVQPQRNIFTYPRGSQLLNGHHRPTVQTLKLSVSPTPRSDDPDDRALVHGGGKLEPLRPESSPLLPVPLVPEEKKQPSGVTSDDVWNAALQATIEPLPSSNNHHHHSVHHGVYPSPLPPTPHSIHNTPADISTPVTKKKSKKRRASLSSLKAKKRRKVQQESVLKDEQFSHIYQNESTMDSHHSVPYSSASEREMSFGIADNGSLIAASPDAAPNPYADRSPDNLSCLSPHQLVHVRRSSSNSRHHIVSPGLPAAVSPPRHFSQSSHITASPALFPKPSKSKKKPSARRTHFTKKRKRKPSTVMTPVLPQLAAAVVDVKHIYDDDDDEVALGYDNGGRQRSSPTVDDSLDSDSTEPMLDPAPILFADHLPLNYGCHYEHDSPHLDQRQQQQQAAMQQCTPQLATTPYSNSNLSYHTNMSDGGGGPQDDMRLKIKIKRPVAKRQHHQQQPNHTYCNSHTDDLSSPNQPGSVSPPPPPQQQQQCGNTSDQSYYLYGAEEDDEDRNSISERLQLMRDESPGPPMSHNHVRCASPLSQRSSPHTVPTDSYDHRNDSLFRHNHGGGGSGNQQYSHTTTPTSNTHCGGGGASARSSSRRKKKHRSKSSGKKSRKNRSGHHRESPRNTPSRAAGGIVSVASVFSDEEECGNHRVVPPLNHALTPELSPPPQPQRLALKISRGPHRTTAKQAGHRHHTISGSTIIQTRIVDSAFDNSTTPLPSPLSQNLHQSSSTLLPPPPPLVTVNINYCCNPGEAYYTSADGTQVYICPICNLEDNGSLMVCCDNCQDWYHGDCLGKTSLEEGEWFCPRCLLQRSLRLPAAASAATGSKKSSASGGGASSRRSTAKTGRSRARKK